MKGQTSLMVNDGLNWFDAFFGTRSIAKAFRKEGFKLYGIEKEGRFQTSDPDMIIGDILTYDFTRFPRGFFQGMWFSPPCTAFSVASIGTHWGGGKRGYVPQTETAKLGMRLVERTQKLIEYFEPEWWFIENPRGVLRNLPLMKGLDRNTIWYCQYGDDRAKPTDIWFKRWPKTMPVWGCKNFSGEQLDDPSLRHCHHQAAPRGAKTGTQGRCGAVERSRIPDVFCRLLAHCIKLEMNSIPKTL